VAAAVCLPALGLAANLVWAKVVHLGTPLQRGLLLHFARTAPGEFVRLGREAVGVFGWQDTFMPKAAYLVWLALVLGLLIGALVAGRGRDRLVVAGALAVLGVVTAGVTAYFAQYGFGMLGRYVVPGAAIIPLVAGEVASRTGRHRPPSALVVMAATLAALVQVLAGLINARRYAVGATGPVLFLRRADWTPPGGWVPWLLVIVTAGVAQVAAAASVARSSQSVLDVGRVRTDVERVSIE
jgi:hypothetical protein